MEKSTDTGRGERIWRRDNSFAILTETNCKAEVIDTIGLTHTALKAKYEGKTVTAVLANVVLETITARTKRDHWVPGLPRHR